MSRKAFTKIAAGLNEALAHEIVRNWSNYWAVRIDPLCSEDLVQRIYAAISAEAVKEHPLRAPAQTQQEPVGWRYAHKGQGDWNVGWKDPREWLAGFSPIEYDIEPLYAHPAQCAPMREALELIKKQVIERGGFTIERGSGAMTVIANALSSVTSTVPAPSETYTEICMNEKCPRGQGVPIEVVRPLTRPDGGGA